MIAMDLTLLHADQKQECQLRLDKARYNMAMAEMDAMLIGAPTNLYYLAGGVFRGYIYVPADGDPVYFLIPPSKADSPLTREIRKPEMIADVLKKEGYDMPRRIGMELQDLYYSEIQRLHAIFPGSELKDATPVMRRARAIKTDFELKLMRQDGLRQTAVYSEIKHCYQEDMTDLEFQIEIERVLRRAGCLGYLRVSGNKMQLNMGSVLSGPNADAPSPYDFSMGGAGTDPSLPVGASGEIMKPGMTVMVDMCSIDILRDLEKFSVPGIRIGDMYKRAAKLADDAGLRDYFMGHNHKVPFIGHGVGIELNEMPVVMERNADPLLKHTTLALEPKFVIPEVGAVGIENTYVVTDEGLSNLTELDETLKQL